jgi:hypothetical protein
MYVVLIFNNSLKMNFVCNFTITAFVAFVVGIVYYSIDLNMFKFI